MDCTLNPNSFNQIEYKHEDSQINLVTENSENIDINDKVRLDSINFNRLSKISLKASRNEIAKLPSIPKRSAF